MDIREEWSVPIDETFATCYIATNQVVECLETAQLLIGVLIIY